MSAVLNRLYEDLLMPSRLADYEHLLKTALEHGYQTHSLLSFWEASKQGNETPAGKHLILRHDVDVVVSTAREMWQLEQRLGVRSSFTFVSLPSHRH